MDENIINLDFCYNCGKMEFTSYGSCIECKSSDKGNLLNNKDIEQLIEMAEQGDIRILDPLLSILEIKELKEKHIKVVELLGRFRDERAVRPLIRMLYQGEEIFRRYAPMSLARTGSKKAIKHLIKLLNDPSLPVKISSLKALGILTDKKTMDFLVTFLTKDKKEYMDKFPDDKTLYFDSLMELISNIVEGSEKLKCYTHLALLYESQVKYYEAEEYILKSIKIKSEDINLMEIYLRVLIFLEKYPEAEQIMKKILEVKHEDLNYLLKYVDILVGLKKYSEAIEMCNDIYITTQEDSLEDKLRELYYYYGKGLEEIGNTKGAVEQYESALLLNQGYEGKDFFESLINYKKENGKIQNWINLLEIYIKNYPQGKWYYEAVDLIKEMKKYSSSPGLVSKVKGLFGK